MPGGLEEVVPIHGRAEVDAHDFEAHSGHFIHFGQFIQSGPENLFTLDDLAGKIIYSGSEGPKSLDVFAGFLDSLSGLQAGCSAVRL